MVLMLGGTDVKFGRWLRTWSEIMLFIATKKILPFVLSPSATLRRALSKHER